MERSPLQNRALHLYFRHLSEELNDAGLDMKKVLRPHVDILWTPENIKEYIFRPIMKALLKKESTTELSTKEVNAVYEIINRHVSEKFGIHVPFPNEEELMWKERTR